MQAQKRRSPGTVTQASGNLGILNIAKLIRYYCVDIERAGSKACTRRISTIPLLHCTKSKSRTISKAWKERSFKAALAGRCREIPMNRPVRQNVTSSETAHSSSQRFSDLTVGTPPPSRQSYSTTPTAPPPAVGVLSLRPLPCISSLKRLILFIRVICKAMPAIWAIACHLTRFCPKFEFFVNTSSRLVTRSAFCA